MFDVCCSGDSNKGRLSLSIVKLIVDAQLPQLLSTWLKDHGYDAIHTLELPEANRSDDGEIIVVAAAAIIVSHQ